jgi:protein lysine acetyltransferase
LDSSASAPLVAWPERVTVRDGSEILIRPIAPDDKQRLVEGFNRLSVESRYRRFLTPTDRLSRRMLRYLTEVDHHDHEALVAESADVREPVGVARFIRNDGDAKAAEVAVTVVDHWQGRGVATELLRRLEERAIEEGIERFTATCLADNTDVLALLEDVGPHRTRNAAGGIVEVSIDLPGAKAPESALRTALRRAASGAVAFVHPREPGPGGDDADAEGADA